MNYIVWKGKSSTSLLGLKILQLPPITKAKKRVTETFINGVDGSFIEELGYEPYDKQIEIGLVGAFDVDEIINYFDGTGTITFSNEPTKFYNATIIDQIDFQRLIRFRKAVIKFRVQPYKYLLIENKFDALKNEVINKGFINSKPLIHLIGSGIVEIGVNGFTAFTYTFPDGEKEVYIDCEKEDAYIGETLRNRHMEGIFPELKSGLNTFNINGNVTLCEVLARSRWI